MQLSIKQFKLHALKFWWLNPFIYSSYIHVCSHISHLIECSYYWNSFVRHEGFSWKDELKENSCLYKIFWTLVLRKWFWHALNHFQWKRRWRERCLKSRILDLSGTHCMLQINVLYLICALIIKTFTSENTTCIIECKHFICAPVIWKVLFDALGTTALMYHLMH